jgi:hypothetical protein
VVGGPAVVPCMGRPPVPIFYVYRLMMDDEHLTSGATRLVFTYEVEVGVHPLDTLSKGGLDHAGRQARQPGTQLARTRQPADESRLPHRRGP